MKIRSLCAAACVLLFAMTVISPTPTHASDWIDELFACTGNYVYGTQSAWADYNTSAKNWEDWDLLTHRLDAAFNSYEGCNSVVNVPSWQYDFCDGAQLAAQNCGVQLAGTDDFGAIIECRNATKVDLCE